MPKNLFYANSSDPSSVETVIIAVSFSAAVTLLFSCTVATFSSLDFLYIHSVTIFRLHTDVLFLFYRS